MIDYLSGYYQQPQSTFFRLGQGMIRHFYVILCLLGAVFMAYPLVVLSYYALPSAAEMHLPNLYEKLAHQQKILAALREKQTRLANSQNLAELNQQIKHILHHHQIQSERLQWQLESSRTLSLSATQSSEKILNTLAELNHIPHLSFVEVTLTKLHRERLVELNALLQITE